MTGVGFRTDVLGASATLRVEAGLGADRMTNSAAWSWTDVTTAVLYADYTGVQIEPIGRSDAMTIAPPAGCRFPLLNDSGDYTAYNPTSANYPNIKRGTPIRVVVNLTGDPADDSIRFQGYAKGFTPSWDATGGHSIVIVQCVGIGQQMSKPTAPIQSAIYRSTISAPGLIEYAPMEEDSGAARISATGVHPQNAIFGGTVTFAGDNTLGGAKQAVVLNSSSYLGIGSLPHSFGGHWQVDWFMKFTGSDPAAETIIMRCWTSNVSAQIVDAVYGGGVWGIRVYAAHGVVVSSATFSVPTGLANGWWHWRVMAHDAGSGTTDYQVVVFPADLSSAGSSGPLSAVAVAPGNLTSAVVLPNAALDGVAMCHWAIYDQWDFSAVDESADGYDGETATDRLQRVALEEGIDITVSGDSSITMGPQKPDQIMAIMRACEVADGGVLYDGQSAGWSYVGETQRYNAASLFTLDATNREVTAPPAAVDDDQRDLNQVTVTLTRGGEATFQQTTGPLGSEEVGVNPGSITANLEDEAEAFQLAAWAVHLGQAEGFRYPQLTMDMIAIAEHAGSTTIPAAWLTATPGSLLIMSNLRSVAPTMPPGDVQLALEGWSETLTPLTWKVTANCSPYSPWDVGSLDGNWLDCGASVTGSTMTTSSTTVDVLVSDACDWTHVDGNFSITIGGEEMTVTAVGSPAATTPSLVATGTAASSDGFSTRTVSPGLPGGATAAGNLLLMLASCRDTNAINTGMYITGASGWKKIFDGVNFAFFAKVHSGSESTPTVNILPFGTIVGDTMIAQIASFSGKWGDPKSQLVAAVQQLNFAAQDIAYPELPIDLGNVLIIWAGWKADDWTSVATLGGVTEIGEPDSTSGNDAGIVWDYNTSAGAPVVVGGSFVVTGGSTAISRGAVIALRYQYQTLTVTRGVNGITRAHSRGEAVHVTHPLVMTRQ